MANIKANMKSHKKDMIRKEYNSKFRLKLKTSIKTANAVAASDDREKLQEKVNNAFKLLDRAENKNIYHKNKVSREKRKLSSLLSNKEN